MVTLIMINPQEKKTTTNKTKHYSSPWLTRRQGILGSSSCSCEYKTAFTLWYLRVCFVMAVPPVISSVMSEAKWIWSGNFLDKSQSNVNFTPQPPNIQCSYWFICHFAFCCENVYNALTCGAFFFLSLVTHTVFRVSACTGREFGPTCWRTVIPYLVTIILSNSFQSNVGNRRKI